MQKYTNKIIKKKAFSMLMTLLVIIIFSTIIILGLKISALQLDSKKVILPYVDMTSAIDEIYPFIKYVLLTKLSCPSNVKINYDKYQTNSKITYQPSCNSRSDNNRSRQIIINMKIYDKENKMSYTKTYYDKLH